MGPGHAQEEVAPLRMTEEPLRRHMRLLQASGVTMKVAESDEQANRASAWCSVLLQRVLQRAQRLPVPPQQLQMSSLIHYRQTAHKLCLWRQMPDRVLSGHKSLFRPVLVIQVLRLQRLDHRTRGMRLI